MSFENESLRENGRFDERDLTVDSCRGSGNESWEFSQVPY